MELIAYVVLTLFSLFFIVLATWKEDYFFYIVAGTLFILLGADLYNNGLTMTMFGSYGVFDTSINETVYGITTDELTLLTDSWIAGMLNILIAVYLFVIPIYNIFIKNVESLG